MVYVKKTKKSKLSIDTALLHVQSTFNNTIATLTTPDGNVICQSSCGALSFKGARKGTPFAASQVGGVIAKEMLARGIKNVEIEVKGPGSGRDSVVRAIQAAGIPVTLLREVTPIPHNGTKAPKLRRV